MTLAEHFSVDRLKRCAEIQMAIMAAARENGGEFNFTVHLTEEPGEAFGFEDLRKSYIAIGVAESRTEVPFIDLMVIIAMVEQEIEAWKEAGERILERKTKLRLEFPTAFSDEEIDRILNQLVFETPNGGRVRLSSSS